MKTIRKEELQRAQKGIKDNSISYVEVDKVIKQCIEEKENGKSLSDSKGDSRENRKEC